jgi:hypothetical protein
MKTCAFVFAYVYNVLSFYERRHCWVRMVNIITVLKMNQEGWPDDHENEWKSAIVREVGSISRMSQRPGIQGVPKTQWGFT